MHMTMRTREHESGWGQTVEWRLCVGIWSLSNAGGGSYEIISIPHAGQMVCATRKRKSHSGVFVEGWASLAIDHFGQYGMVGRIIYIASFMC